jgi:hypothetical protein
MTPIGQSLACLTLAAAAANPLLGQSAAPAGGGLRLTAERQLEQIFREKSTRTEAQKKLDTPLVYAVRELDGDAVMRDLPRLSFPLSKDQASRLEVDIQGAVTPALLQAIAQEGGSVVSSFPRYRAVRAYLPPAAIERLAERAEVTHIRPADEPIVWRSAAKKANTSQGDLAHRAAQARALFGVDGRGVKVGVLSDSVEALAGLQASGDLPAVTVLSGQAGAGDSEGTAMLEIVHDLAPGSQLFFATSTGGEAALAANIRALAKQGCKVIVDDFVYPREGVFQDSVAAQAVADVAASGVAYFSAAGNSGNLSSATGGTWEGNFQAGGAFANGTLHDFGGGVLFDPLVTAASPATRPIVLQWSDPLGGSGNDYDLCLLDASANRVIGCSTTVQDGNDDPAEILFGQQDGRRIVIVNRDGNQSPRFLHLTTFGGKLAAATAGHIFGHSAAAGTFSIAAVDAAEANGGAFVGGPVNPVEIFSSDGPRRIFFQADGTAVTPGNFLASGGTVRQKPDFAAADGVATATGVHFDPFYGTSAAAPHAAAIAALMLDRNPTAGLDTLRSALESGALDIMAAGVDRDSGFGIIDAVKAVDAMGAGGSATPCVPDDYTACLVNGRFEVAADWRTDPDTAGRAQVMYFGGQRAETDQSVLWWYFAPANFEMGVKVLEACVPSLGYKYWVFIGGLTNQGWTVHVRDTRTGATKTYTNPVGHLSQTFADTVAFDCP